MEIKTFSARQLKQRPPFSFDYLSVYESWKAELYFYRKIGFAIQFRYY